MLDWDSTSIVFTKRSLLEFLKYTGTTVDTNFNNISKLPRYAKFGKLSDIAEDLNSMSNSTSQDSQKDVSFKPSRRVRADPGGPTHDIFAHDEGEDALSLAPSKPNDGYMQNERQLQLTPDQMGAVNQEATSFKPSRRVRTNPGGDSSLGDLWGGGEVHTSADFKPTRRVRQGPGGQDHISDIF
ncbi:hypothetical protein AMATHDRAFT_70080 [Amanita thiersii Skay4041]|uniref:Uncharacterized protein n=1 Tax=Amanita thiersii Skay4041 TaxID=703135 RepID=A0A2A9N8X6_9AGAR|nr:hypothetical protein AMATHDRAFT_70080 [Amanita thiersii Skay4041]